MPQRFRSFSVAFAPLTAAMFLLLLLPAHAFDMHGVIFSSWSPWNSTGAQAFRMLTDTVPATNGWTSIVVTYYQHDINSTDIAPVPETLSPAGVAEAVSIARAKGLKVALKPHVDLSGDPAHWRGEIGTYFTPEQWILWFYNYQTYLASMAKLAADLHMDLLIVGTELSFTQPFERYWRAVIAACRDQYTGPMVYASNHGESGSVAWWDALDYIGVDAYFSLATHENAPLEEVLAGWTQVVPSLRQLAAQWNKTLLFTEIGYQSLSDTAIHPWASDGTLSLGQQDVCYEAFYQTFAQEGDWFGGVFWWAWSDDPKDGGSTDTSFTPKDKPAVKRIQAYGL